MTDEEKKEYEKIKYNNEHLYCDKKDVDYLINLIEKQSKEIEELKEKNENLLDALNNSIDIRKYWISKDKIKAKIEEVHYKMIGHQDLREAVKQVLNSLLEKE